MKGEPHGQENIEKSNEESIRQENALDEVTVLGTRRGPQGARQLLLDAASDPTLTGVVILSLHGDKPARYATCYVSIMEKIYLMKVMDTKLNDELYE